MMVQTIEAAKRPITNLFHDPGYKYISSIEPGADQPIEVRLRTQADNVTQAFVEISSDGTTWTAYEMTKEGRDKTGYYDFFKGTIPPQKQMFKYCFRCQNEDPANTVYYARTYIGPEQQSFTEKALEWDNCWALNPTLHTPDWAKGALWYSIMPDCFYNGDPTNDEVFSGHNYSNSWNHVHHDLCDKYGGDLCGIAKKLDHLQSLGIDAIFMDPAFKSNQNAGYGPEFYKQIEHSMGNKSSMVALSRAIHEKSMRFIMDVVFSFVQPQSIWYNHDNLYPFPGAQQDWNNQYHDRFWFTGEEGDTHTYKSLWGGVELNHCNEALCEEIYSGEDAYLPRLLKEPFSFDGFRFDTGGALYGTDENGKRVGDPIVVGKMRPYLKACNPEAMMMSEYSMHPAIDSGTWDARWNLQFVKEIQHYITGEIPESEIYHWLDFEVMNIPRTAALCQYFALSDHDRPRNHRREKYAIRPAQLILMTMLGAPCIYYGDEVDIDREDYSSSFYAMDWHEERWDYATLSFYRALSDMRRKNSCLRQGAVKFLSVDDENHILAFARMDENGTAVTIASRNPYSVRFAVDVRDLEDVDGTVYTDWLTGKQYVAEDGYIEAEVMAGGTVLVKGTASAENKGGYTFTAIGNGQAEAVLQDVRRFAVTGRGDAENFVFAHTEVFGECKVTAKFATAKGDALLLVRNDTAADSAFVGAGVADGELYLLVREQKGGAIRRTALEPVAAGAYVRIVRDAYNRFTVLTTRTPGSVWQEAATAYAALDNHAKAGFAVLRGEAVLDCVKVAYEKTPVKCDDFRHGLSAMFDCGEHCDLRYTADGLVIRPDGHTALLTNAPYEDWTLKTELGYTPAADGYAGIISRQDEDNFVVAGRKLENGRPVLFLGRANAGKLLTYYSVPDTQPAEKVTVQLQRIGTTYSAVFTYDGARWTLIGRGLNANYCVERAGLVVDGAQEALFSYASFGDAIHDGESTNTPRTPGVSAPDYRYMKDTEIQPAYRIIAGDWAYANEGYIQKSTDIAQMGIPNKTFGDLRADGTYMIDEGQGFVGFEFGKKGFDTPLGDGILFCYDEQGRVQVTQGDTVLGSAQLTAGYGIEQRLCVDLKDGYLTVFAGEEGTPILHIRLQAPRGYVAYVTKGVVAHINSASVGSNDTVLYRFHGYNYHADGFSNTWEHTLSFVNPFGIAMTDYVVTAKVMVDKIPTYVKNPYVGVYLSGVEGKFYEGMALNVTMDRSGRVMLRDGEKVLQSAPLAAGQGGFSVLVAKKGCDYRVYIDGAKEPTFTYTDACLRGGVISFVSNQLKASFRGVAMADLQPDETAEDTALFQSWMTDEV